MGSDRKELGIPVKTWKGEGELSRNDLLVRVRDCSFPAVEKIHCKKTCQNCQTRWLGEDEMASSQKKSQSRSLHRCASWRGFTPWHCSTWLSRSVTETHPALPHASGSIPRFV